MTRKNEAHEQVDAFLALLQERLGVDEEKLRHVVSRVEKNGTHVTWMWVVAALLSLCSALLLSVGVLLINRIEAMERSIEVISGRQSDVRERLRSIEDRAK